MTVCFSLWAATVQAPSEYSPTYSIIQGNSLIAISHIFNYSEEYWIMLDKYPDMIDNLYCLWEEESRFGTNMGPGDNGLAFGHFQIHIDKHPEVSYECAMGFECSLDFTVKSIKAGYGWWWTPFEKCFNNN